MAIGFVVLVVVVWEEVVYFGGFRQASHAHMVEIEVFPFSSRDGPIAIGIHGLPQSRIPLPSQEFIFQGFVGLEIPTVRSTVTVTGIERV